MKRRSWQIELPHIGETEDIHNTLSHHGGDPQALERKAKVDTYFVSEFARLVARLKSAKDVDGVSMLDRTILHLGSGLNNGDPYKDGKFGNGKGSHACKDIPLLCVGGKALGLKHSQHLLHTGNKTPACNLLYTYAKAMGLSDAGFGDSTDRTRSRHGRRHPWIFASALPLAVSLYLVFAPPAGLTQWQLFAWMLGWTLVNRFALTMFHVPYLALGAELTRDWHERTVLVSLRHSFGQLALFAPAVLGFMWLFSDGAGDGAGRFHAPAYPQYAAICAIAVFALVVASAWWTRDRIPQLAAPDPHSDGRNAISATFHDLWALLQQAGACVVIHSDDENGIQRLNQEAAKAMTRGKLAGLDIPPERAIRWVTANPAKSLGILGQTGTLEAGKMADVVIWNGTPFSVYALADQVFVDGVLLFDRANPAAKPRSDFSL